MAINENKKRLGESEGRELSYKWMLMVVIEGHRYQENKLENHFR